MNHIQSIFGALQRNSFISDAEQSFLLRVFQKSYFLLHMIAQALNYFLVLNGSRQIVNLAVNLLLYHYEVFAHYPQLHLQLVRRAHDFYQAEAVVTRSPLSGLLRAYPCYKKLELEYYKQLNVRQNRACMLVQARKRQRLYLVKCLLSFARCLYSELFVLLADIYQLYPTDLHQIFKMQVVWQEVDDFVPPTTRNVPPRTELIVRADVSALYQSERVRSYFAGKYERIKHNTAIVNAHYAEFARLCTVLRLPQGQIGEAHARLCYELSRLGFV